MILLLATPSAALAHSLKHGDIAIGHAWALPSRNQDGQVFFPLLNAGTSEDSLVAARTEVAAYVELRTNVHYVDPAESRFELKPGTPIPMRPTARHLRLVGLNKPLVKGDRFSLILDFEQAGEVEIEVYVEASPGS